MPTRIKNMLSIDYLGSKKKLLPFLNEIFSKYITKDSCFADLFSGTGVVAHFVASTYNCKVISNDAQYYSYLLQRACLTKYSSNDIKIITDKINEYNNIHLVIEDFFTQNYSPPERMYFTENNALLIDTIKSNIENDKHTFSQKIYDYLLASLISACSEISNVSCQYGAYLKKFKTKATHKITLKHFLPNNTTTENICLNKNIMSILDRKYDVVYLDPPYNTRQYGGYYHILETLALNDKPDITGKTGMRNYDDKKSNFSSKNKVLQEFTNLIDKLKCNVIILSYNDEGIIKHKDIKQIMEKHGRLTIHTKEYKKFKAQKDVKRKQTTEYLFVLEK